MITRIKIENFKSLRDVDLKLGAFNLFIGTNASGKSNLLDALRFLQGVGYGFTIQEILDGKPKSSTSEVWDAIRGGSSKLAFVPVGTPSSNGNGRTVKLSVSMNGSKPPLHYRIGFSPKLVSVREESLLDDQSTVYDSADIDNPESVPYFKVKHYHGKKGTQPQPEFEKSRPVLQQMLRHEACRKDQQATIERCIRTLSNTQRIDPSPVELRKYSQAQTIRRMGEHGENFAALVNAIIEDPAAKSDYLGWLQRLTPTELDDVTILRGAVDEPLFAVKEGGLAYPATILSDGTLRFAAITAAFFQPDMPDVMTIEEIENGIHPSRLRLLVELLRSQSGGQRQVIATTHSPIVLAWLSEEEYATTFLCTRDEATGESKITPLRDIPSFMDVVKRRPIADLFAEGWLEAAF